MANCEEGSIRMFWRIPICGIIFSALALHFHIYFEQRIDFITLSRKCSMGSGAKIRIGVIIEEMILRIDGCFGAFDDT